MRIKKAQKAAGGRLTGVFGDLLVRRFFVRQPEMYRVIETVVSRRLSSIDKAALCELAQTAMDLDFDGIKGDFLHIGADEGAALVLEKAKRRSRSLSVHTPPYESLPKEGEVALAHLDCPEYAAMRSLLENVVPRLARGGHLIIDGYKSHEDCRRAVDEHFHGRKGFRLELKSRLHVIRDQAKL